MNTAQSTTVNLNNASTKTSKHRDSNSTVDNKSLATLGHSQSLPSPPSDGEDRQKSLDSTIHILLDNHIVENRRLLHESWVNLDKIADYCEANYLQSNHKEAALEETKNYTNRALASVANQIHNFASNLLTLFDLQISNINELEAQANLLKSRTQFTHERTSRREIGKLTKPKLLPNPTSRVIKPLHPERNAAKKRRTNFYSATYANSIQDRNGPGGSGIDYTVFDDIGEAHKIYEHRSTKLKSHRNIANNPYSTMRSGGLVNGYIATGSNMTAGNNAGAFHLRTGTENIDNSGARRWMPQVKSATLRPSKSSNLSAYGSGHQTADKSGRSPAPSMRPPTPPLGGTMNRFSRAGSSSVSAGGGGGGGGSKEYRSLVVPPVVAPPQLPSNYKTPDLATSTAAAKDTIGHVEPSKNTKPSTQIISSNKRSESMHPAGGVMSSVTSNPPSTIVVTPAANNHNGTENSNQHYQKYNNFTNPFEMTNTNKVEHPLRVITPSPTPSPPSPNSMTTAAADISWIPENYLEKVVAMYDYEADKDDELTFKENAIIYVTAKNEDGWWEGVMNGITGLFPGNYVEPCFW